jgi:hypothetical protein
MRGLTRLTSECSNKVENLARAISLHVIHYHFAPTRQSLTSAARLPTPAMAAQVSNSALGLPNLTGTTRLIPVDNYIEVTTNMLRSVASSRKNCWSYPQMPGKYLHSQDPKLESFEIVPVVLDASGLDQNWRGFHFSEAADGR